MIILGYDGVVEPLADGLGGGYVGYIPALRGCISDGATAEEAALNLEDAARGWLSDAKASGRHVPEASTRTHLYA